MRLLLVCHGNLRFNSDGIHMSKVEKTPVYKED